MAKKKLTPEMQKYFAEIGSNGGKIGGVKRWAGVKAADRSQRMRELVALRKDRAAGKASGKARQAARKSAKLVNPAD